MKMEKMKKKTPKHRVSMVAQLVKNQSTKQKTRILFLGQENQQEKG